MSFSLENNCDSLLDDELLVLALIEHEQKMAKYYDVKDNPLLFGIANSNKNSYVGSCIISFLNIMGMRNLLLELTHTNSKALIAKQGERSYLKLLARFLVCQLYGDREPFNEKAKRAAEGLIQRATIDMPEFRPNREEDAVYFFAALDKLVEKQLATLSQNSDTYLVKFRHTWQLRIRDKFLCEKNHVNEYTKIYKRLLLNYDQQIKSLDDLLRDTQRSDLIDSAKLTCKKCNAKSMNGTRFREFINAPPTLLIALYRIYPRPHSSLKPEPVQKCMQHVDIPLTIDMNNYWSQELQSPTDSIYSLTSVVFHVGTNFDQGHYTCKLKISLN